MKSLFPETELPIKPKTARGLLAWRSTPPATLPERWATIADLDALLNDPTLDWSDAHRAIATSCYVLSGPELNRVINGLIGLLREGIR